jgi:hypothetical protein
VISYCIAALRPLYARRLVEDLVGKATVPSEVLIWMNTEDTELETFLAGAGSSAVSVRLVGKSPGNIGMSAYRKLFQAARYPLITQVDDDVVCVSRGIPERAARIFQVFPAVRQIVSDVWQDDFTTGARPPLSGYRCINEQEGLYDGPVDGWFSIYHRSILPMLLSLPYSPYCCIGHALQMRLRARRLLGVLCTRMKVFHVIGPQYASAFGMLDFEIDKYVRLGRPEIVKWYAESRSGLQSERQLRSRVEDIIDELDQTVY